MRVGECWTDDSFHESCNDFLLLERDICAKNFVCWILSENKVNKYKWEQKQSKKKKKNKRKQESHVRWRKIRNKGEDKDK